MSDLIFSKYHALGNDYIIINPEDISGNGIDIEKVKRICHRNFGVGSDGILFGPLDSSEGDFGLRIYNPDGSEAEKSGNGLRIFSRYLWDKGLVQEKPFTILTDGGLVKSQIFGNGRSVRVDMGKVSFISDRIPVWGPQREVINEKITINNEDLIFNAATIGNPHCVVVCDKLAPERVKKLGPVIENHEIFPNRTNVQFMRIVDRQNIQIEIWERGAGYTLASGSSSSASAAVAKRLGHCDSDINVHMPGGVINISISDDFSITMTGPVTKVSVGQLSYEIFDNWSSPASVCAISGAATVNSI